MALKIPISKSVASSSLMSQRLTNVSRNTVRTFEGEGALMLHPSTTMMKARPVYILDCMSTLCRHKGLAHLKSNVFKKNIERMVSIKKRTFAEVTEEIIQEGRYPCCNVMEVVFVNKELVEGKLFDVNFDKKVHDSVFQKVLSLFSSEGKFQQRNFKRYSLQDMTCEIHNNRDIRVQRNNKHISLPFVGYAERQTTDEYLGIATLMNSARLPVSAFPCRTDMNDVQYVRQITVPVAEIRSNNNHTGILDIRFESICSNIVSPLFKEKDTNDISGVRMSTMHKISVLLDLTKCKDADNLSKMTDVVRVLLDVIRSEN